MSLRVTADPEGPTGTARKEPKRRNRGGRLERYLFVVLEGERLDAGGLRIALRDVQKLRIGRGDARRLSEHHGVHVLEVPDRHMSATHANIHRSGAAFLLADASSTNGTFVNGANIAKHLLRDGDVLELGETLLVYSEIELDDECESHLLNLDSTAAVAALGFATLDPNLASSLARLAAIAKSSGAVGSILLLGETGAGKEVLAQGLHEASGRPGELVAINCGAIPASLLESHLFGHVAGAYTGAQANLGVFRAAHRGTVLLDEIGDLPLASQAALLRVLQDRKVQPLGTTQTTTVDVRIVAATHMPLEQLVARGAFRRDLYARLNGYTFRVPPLRERIVDLGLLIAALLAAGKLGTRPGVRIRSEAARALVRRDWTMNVRELEKCLGAACALAQDGVITVDDLPAAAAAPASDDGAKPRPADRDGLLAVLENHGWNLSTVAQELRTSRTQVYRLIERHGIERPRDDGQKPWNRLT